MKKHIYILILLLFPSLSAWGQTDLDSLYRSGFHKFDNARLHDTLKYKPYPTREIYLFGYLDRHEISGIKTNVTYLYVENWRRTGPEHRYNTGWVAFDNVFQHALGVGYADPYCIYGAQNEIPTHFFYLGDWSLTQIETVSIICLNQGIPCFHWNHQMTWPDSDRDDMAERYESYENGLLHGPFRVMAGDFLYETEFDHGTGDYLDVFPDGAPRRQGRMVDGYMDGKWYFYARTKSGEYTARIDADFDMGRVCRYSLDEFIDGQWVMKRFVSGSGE